MNLSTFWLSFVNECLVYATSICSVYLRHDFNSMFILKFLLFADMHHILFCAEIFSSPVTTLGVEHHQLLYNCLLIFFNVIIMCSSIKFIIIWDALYASRIKFDVLQVCLYLFKNKLCLLILPYM